MIFNLISILTILIPTLGLISGFSIALTIRIFLLLILIALQNKISINYINIKRNLLLNWKLELAFALWCFITISYSLNYLSSLLVYIQIGLIALIGFIVHGNIDRYNKVKKIFPVRNIVCHLHICYRIFISWSHKQKL